MRRAFGIERIGAFTERRRQPVCPHRFPDRNMFHRLAVIGTVVNRGKRFCNLLHQLLVLPQSRIVGNIHPALAVFLGIRQRVKVFAALFQLAVDRRNRCLYFVNVLVGNALDFFQNVHFKRLQRTDHFLQMRNFLLQQLFLFNRYVAVNQSVFKRAFLAQVFFVNPVFLRRNLADFLFNDFRPLQIFVNVFRLFFGTLAKILHQCGNIFMHRNKVAHQIDICAARLAEFALLVGNNPVGNAVHLVRMRHPDAQPDQNGKHRPLQARRNFKHLHPPVGTDNKFLFGKEGSAFRRLVIKRFRSPRSSLVSQLQNPLLLILSRQDGRHKRPYFSGIRR